MDAEKMIRTVFAGCALVWLLMVSSCALLGTGTMVMVNGLANSQAAHKLSKKAREWENEAHNDRANREASVHTRDDYVEDYRENYD